MKRGCDISRVDSPPADAHVSHYDQLDEGVEARLPEILPEDDGETVEVAEDPDAFAAYDVVKFTRFYRITPPRSAFAVRPTDASLLR